MGINNPLSGHANKDYGNRQETPPDQRRSAVALGFWLRPGIRPALP
jgi:hypothetical protein